MKKILLLCLVALSLSLSGCAFFKRGLSSQKTSTQTTAAAANKATVMTVMTQSPLVLPPDYNLRMPTPGDNNTYKGTSPKPNARLVSPSSSQR